MIELKSILKTYITGDTKINALNNIDLKFRNSEFVSILGQSGCGKTTMLNIVGGLDRYTSGDLIIEGVSTKDYKDKDWDNYRNKKVGFVFQSYNLISHLSILNNVELALTLSGVNKKERREKAKQALIEVGLQDHLKKRPNQLSGGQMQRVAIARALVNNPTIILADEPTGALDSNTSTQIMELLKKISKNRLIVMVTHNNEIAEQYSSRIIKMKDGVIENDSNPITEKEQKKFDRQLKKEQKEQKAQLEKVKNEQTKKHIKKQSSMSYGTSLSLSGKNLWSKKAKTFITAFAGSIGIIGIALVLAISNGFSAYITQMQTDILGGFPIKINATTLDMGGMLNASVADQDRPDDFNDDDFISVEMKDITQLADLSQMFVYNYLSPEFVKYINDYKSKENEKYYNELSFSYSSPLNIVSAYKGNAAVNTGSKSVFEGLANNDYVKNQYDVLYGSYPKEYNEVALVIPANNYVSNDILKSFGIELTQQDNQDVTIKFDDIAKNLNLQVVGNDDYYKYDNVTDSFSVNQPTSVFNNSNNINLKITSILRIKEKASVNIFSTGIMYMPELTDKVRLGAEQSEIVQKQLASADKIYMGYEISTFDMAAAQTNMSPITTKNCTSIIELQTILKMIYGVTVDKDRVIDMALTNLSASQTPTTLNIFPVDFDGKQQVLNYIGEWNNSTLGKNNEIRYSDNTAMFTSAMTQMVDIISYVLIAFASVSLFVSSVMIGVLTYASVLERRKEIGVLRSIGARKKDISRVFNSETFIIGASAGSLGVLVTYALCPIINMIVKAVAGSAFTANIAILNPVHAISLVVISCGLTLIAGLFPARIAAKNDPVKALRSE